MERSFAQTLVMEATLLLEVVWVCMQVGLTMQNIGKCAENLDSNVPFFGRHNTTTDEILLFDSEVPDSQNQLQKLKLNLLKHNKRQLKKGWPLPIIVLLCK
jgi:hypothetical protein